MIREYTDRTVVVCDGCAREFEPTSGGNHPRAWSKEEQPDKTNMYFCPECKGNRRQSEEG